MTEPHRPPRPQMAVPAYVSGDVTPVTAMHPTSVYIGEGEHRHMDVEETIKMMAFNLDQVRRRVSPSAQASIDDAVLEKYEVRVQRASRWGGWVWGAFSVVALIFSAGIGWAVFMGENATDTEMIMADKAAIIQHNGDVDPQAIDDTTHKAVGEHPDMKKAIQLNTETLVKIETEILPPIILTQKKLDKRSEYQYELTKWESRVAEARRRKREAPPKPPRLDTLEGELLRGDYD